jgi:Holliday junction resolvasome RuvABC endonuclease subunit
VSVLGIRCSNRDYTFAVMTGTKKSPQLVDSQTLSYPKGFSKPESLNWLLKEIEELISKYGVEKIVMNKFEARRYGNTYEDRVEHEAMIYLAAFNQGIKSPSKKVKSSIAKDLGLKGRAHYLKTSLDTSLIKGFNDQSPKSQDAILAGWSGLS